MSCILAQAIAIFLVNARQISSYYCCVKGYPKGKCICVWAITMAKARPISIESTKFWCIFHPFLKKKKKERKKRKKIWKGKKNGCFNNGNLILFFNSKWLRATQLFFFLALRRHIICSRYYFLKYLYFSMQQYTKTKCKRNSFSLDIEMRTKYDEMNLRMCNIACLVCGSRDEVFVDIPQYISSLEFFPQYISSLEFFPQYIFSLEFFIHFPTDLDQRWKMSVVHIPQCILIGCQYTDSYQLCRLERNST